MDLLDLFYKTLADTNEMSLAIAAVNKELLKRKTNIVYGEENYEAFKNKHERLVKLLCKIGKIRKIIY